MRILLIEPPFSRLKKMVNIFFPLGLGYLASMLSKNGFEVKLYNAENPENYFGSHGSRKALNRIPLNRHKYYGQALRNPGHPVWKEVEMVLKNFRPDLVGITVRSAKFPSALNVARLVKKINRNCLVVFGGPHPTIAPDESITNNSVDFLIRGEGEETLLQLCQCLQSGKDVDGILGLSYKRSEKIFNNPQRPLIQELDKLPFPGRELVFFPERYISNAMGALITSRGCPYECGYCSAKSIWTRRVRNRSIGNVIEEIKEMVQTFKLDHLYFWDDSFTVDRKNIINLCRSIKKEFNGISWRCTSRIDLLDDELLTAMKDSGCTGIDVGIESGSERVLKQINKGIDLQNALKVVKMIRKHRINCGAFFMTGFPEENEEDILATKNFIKKLKASSICLSIFTPYPRTELYDKAKSLNLISGDFSWDKFDHQSPENFFIKSVEKEKFRKLVNQMARTVDKYNYKEKIKFYTKSFFQNPGKFVSKVYRRIKKI